MYYESLQEANAAASAGETITVVGNVALAATVTSNANITINSGVILDLNGYTLDMGNNYLYSSGHVVDSSGDKGGRLKVATYAENEKEGIQAGTPKGKLAEDNTQMPVYISDE